MTEERPLAVLDVGSNTIRLLVAQARAHDLVTVVDASEFVRLGFGVDRTRELHPDRQEAAIVAIRALSRRAREAGADRVLAIATSAVRDAVNGERFARRVYDATHVELTIISGEREAELTFLGATLGIDVQENVLVCDLGGGSAEIIDADKEGVLWSTSEPLGSSRLTEQFVRHDPPVPEEQEAIRTRVRRVLEPLPQAHPTTAIFTGGTATNAARIAGLDGSSTRLDQETLSAVAVETCTLQSAALVEKYGIQDERARVLAAGVTALAAIADFYQTETIMVTHHGIRDGAIVDMLKREGTWPTSAP